MPILKEQKKEDDVEEEFNDWENLEEQDMLEAAETFCVPFSQNVQNFDRKIAYDNMKQILSISLKLAKMNAGADKENLEEGEILDWKCDTMTVTYFIGQMGVILPDVVTILTSGRNPDVLLSTFGFLHVLFQSVEAVKEIFKVRPGTLISSTSLFAAFRIFLISPANSPRVKAEGVQILLTILGTNQSKSQEPAPSFGETNLSLSSVLQLMLQTDLDYCLLKCFYTSEKKLFNIVIEIFILMTSDPVFPHLRMIQVLEESFRVTCLMICDEGIDREAYFRLIWTACRTLGKVPQRIKDRILQLIRCLMERPPFAALGVAQFSELVSCCPDSTGEENSISTVYKELILQGNYSLIHKLLKTPTVRLHLGSFLLADANFLQMMTLALSMSSANLNLESGFCAYDIVYSLLEILEDSETSFYENLEPVLWKLSFFSRILQSCGEFPVISMIKLFRFLLSKDFKSSLVKVFELEQGDEKKVRDCLSTIELSLHNFPFRKKEDHLTLEEDEILWTTLMEILQYRRRTYSNGSGGGVCSKSNGLAVAAPQDGIYRFSVRIFLLSYLRARPNFQDISTKCLEYIHEWTFDFGEMLWSCDDWTRDLTNGIRTALDNDMLNLLSSLHQCFEDYTESENDDDLWRVKLKAEIEKSLKEIGTQVWFEEKSKSYPATKIVEEVELNREVAIPSWNPGIAMTSTTSPSNARAMEEEAGEVSPECEEQVAEKKEAKQDSSSFKQHKEAVVPPDVCTDSIDASSLNANSPIADDVASPCANGPMGDTATPGDFNRPRLDWYPPRTFRRRFAVNPPSGPRFHAPRSFNLPRFSAPSPENFSRPRFEAANSARANRPRNLSHGRSEDQVEQVSRDFTFFAAPTPTPPPPAATISPPPLQPTTTLPPFPQPTPTVHPPPYPYLSQEIEDSWEDDDEAWAPDQIRLAVSTVHK